MTTNPITAEEAKARVLLVRHDVKAWEACVAPEDEPNWSIGIDPDEKIGIGDTKDAAWLNAYERMQP